MTTLNSLMYQFSWEKLLLLLIELVCLVFSIMVHEVAHGWAAYRLGDPTAKNAGRLTLNPAKHLDPMGSVILPLCCLALGGGFMFAYAKPVPYNPRYFKNRKAGEMIVAFAGPLSNLLQALFGAAVYLAAANTYAGGDIAYGGLSYQVLRWTCLFGSYYCLINLVLCFFNIIPLPPLDGATILTLLLNERGVQVFYKVKQYPMFILLALLVLVPMVTPWDPLAWYMRHTADALYSLLLS